MLLDHFFVDQRHQTLTFSLNNDKAKMLEYVFVLFGIRLVLVAGLLYVYPLIITIC